MAWCYRRDGCRTFSIIVGSRRRRRIWIADTVHPTLEIRTAANALRLLQRLVHEVARPYHMSAGLLARDCDEATPDELGASAVQVVEVLQPQ